MTKKWGRVSKKITHQTNVSREQIKGMKVINMDKYDKRERKKERGW